MEHFGYLGIANCFMQVARGELEEGLVELAAGEAS